MDASNSLEFGMNKRGFGPPRKSSFQLPSTQSPKLPGLKPRSRIRRINSSESSCTGFCPSRPLFPTHVPSSPGCPRKERCVHFQPAKCTSEANLCASPHRLATSFSVHANPSSVHQLPYAIPPISYWWKQCMLLLEFSCPLARC